jgi:hypothetical protein
LWTRTCDVFHRYDRAASERSGTGWHKGNRRRDFIARVVGSAAAWPLVARAQQVVPVIGFLGAASPEHYAHLIDVYRQGLTEAGYDDGRNVTIDFRWAESQYDRLPAFAAAWP